MAASVQVPRRLAASLLPVRRQGSLELGQPFLARGNSKYAPCWKLAVLLNEVFPFEKAYRPLGLLVSPHRVDFTHEVPALVQGHTGRALVHVSDCRVCPRAAERGVPNRHHVQENETRVMLCVPLDPLVVAVYA